MLPVESSPDAARSLIDKTNVDIAAAAMAGYQSPTAEETNAPPLEAKNNSIVPIPTVQLMGVASVITGIGKASLEAPTEPKLEAERELSKTSEKRKSEKFNSQPIQTILPELHADRICFMVTSSSFVGRNSAVEQPEPRSEAPMVAQDPHAVSASPIVPDATVVAESDPVKRPDMGLEVPLNKVDNPDPVQPAPIILKPSKTVASGSAGEIAEFLRRGSVAVIQPGGLKPTINVRTPNGLAPELLDKRLVPPLAVPAELLRMARGAASEIRSQSSGPSVDKLPVNRVPAGETETQEQLKLDDFAVTRFEFKTEFETPLTAATQQAQTLQIVRITTPVREDKPGRLTDSDIDSPLHDPNSQSLPLFSPATIAAPESVEHVRLVFEPPPLPPVVRSVSMDIGEENSQVRVIIRERNGSLNIQFGSTNERLRQDLQITGPMLMRALQRHNHPSVTLNFTNFGSTTDADSEPHTQSQPKKALKSGAQFAGVAETAYLPASDPLLKSL